MTADMIKPGAVVIDCGINHIETGGAKRLGKVHTSFADLKSTKLGDVIDRFFVYLR